jgi:hypothetical protein
MAVAFGRPLRRRRRRRPCSRSTPLRTSRRAGRTRHSSAPMVHSTSRDPSFAAGAASAGAVIGLTFFFFFFFFFFIFFIHFFFFFFFFYRAAVHQSVRVAIPRAGSDLELALEASRDEVVANRGTYRNPGTVVPKAGAAASAATSAAVPRLYPAAGTSTPLLPAPTAALDPDAEERVAAAACGGGGHIAAVTASGALFTLGSNEFGQLGTGQTVAPFSRVARRVSLGACVVIGCEPAIFILVFLFSFFHFVRDTTRACEESSICCPFIFLSFFKTPPFSPPFSQQ